MLPPAIPIFPLPNVVLFPHVLLPLHIFEARYRAMVRTALADDRLIGMVLLQSGSRAEDEGLPSVHAVGCAGVITHAERLDDGRYNIVLRGLERFRIVAEERGAPYRIARVETLPDTIPETDRIQLQRERHHLEALLAAAAERAGGAPRLSESVGDADLVNALAQYMDLEPLERQALLEQDGALARCRALINLLQMRQMAPRGTAWKGGAIH